MGHRVTMIYVNKKHFDRKKLKKVLIGSLIAKFGLMVQKTAILGRNLDNGTSKGTSK